ncbi:MAG: membrane dipeptidase [Cyclobacteriaceae bacterium]
MRRKEFIQKSSLLVGSAFFSGLPFTQCSSKKPPATVEVETTPSVPTFDLHCHPGLFFAKGEERYPGDNAFRSSLTAMAEQNINGGFFSIVSDWPLLRITENGVVTDRPFNKGEAWAEYKKQLSGLNELLSNSGKSISTNARDLSTDDLSIFVACEGGDFLEGDVDRVNEAYSDGVRSVQLVHYTATDVGDLQTIDPIHNGLSDFGKNLVQRMDQLGMIIDVAHASFKTVQDVVEITNSPLILSHSLLNNGSDSPVANRTISEDHAKLIAKNGGVIGAWPSGYSTNMDEFVANTLSLVDLVGVDHVGIGTDMDANYKPVVKDYAEFNLWAEMLAKKGMTENDVAKITGGNAQRVLTQVLSN